MFQRMVGSARKYVVLDAQVFRLMKDVSESLRAVQGKAIFFYYEGNIVRNLQRRYDGITRKPTAKYTIARGDFLIM